MHLWALLDHYKYQGHMVLGRLSSQDSKNQLDTHCWFHWLIRCHNNILEKETELLLLWKEMYFIILR